jgi:SAM-dependent methyltransferase
MQETGMPRLQPPLPAVVNDLAPSREAKGSLAALMIEWYRRQWDEAPDHLGAADLVDVLAELYRRQREIEPDNVYLAIHGTRRFITSQVRNFRWYARYLPDRGAVLDWGCNHAPDSCLLRARFGDRLELHSCDFIEPGRYRAFGDYARTVYTQLHDLVKLPYPDQAFRAIIGAGVLEHTAMDYEVLKELYRVLEPDGTLALTYLPNRLSVEEWVRRVIHRTGFHRRLYGLGEAERLLKRTGFYPVTSGYHCYLGEKLAAALGGGKWPQRLGGLAERLFVARRFVSALRLVARKVTVM